MIIFIILCMVLEAYDLSRSIDAMVVRPVEKMLGTVQMMAQILTAVAPDQADGRFQGVKSIDDFNDLDPFAVGEDGKEKSEAEVLEVVFSKFTFLINKFMKQSMVEEAEINALATDYESKGVVQDILGLSSAVITPLFAVPSSSIVNTGEIVTKLPVDEDTLDSWELNVWTMSTEEQSNVVRYYLFDHLESVARIWTDVSYFFKFQELVRIQYVESNPYHNYIHACDVVASVFRVFTRLRCREWLSDIDIFALLVAALCHDMAHPGWTTPFLVETRHEFAVRYNDASPLENMHCAKLFETCSQEGANVFQRFEKDAYKQARKVCISSILHTDNAKHGEMVKAVKETYELCSDICDAQAHDPEWFTEPYIEDVLYKFTPMWHQLILHLCDVSNPLKPWNISRALATRVQDEFFNQGDEEKRLGIPVGMLNDRDKVNRSGAEHGFINFLVSPLVLATVSSFPYLHPLAVQMADNLKEWRNLWVQDTKPSAEEVEKRDGDVKKVREQVEKLADRKVVHTVRNDGTSSRSTKLQGHSKKTVAST
jgi:cAMP-specific phosphodiesterase 4